MFFQLLVQILHRKLVCHTSGVMYIRKQLFAILVTLLTVTDWLSINKSTSEKLPISSSSGKTGLYGLITEHAGSK